MQTYNQLISIRMKTMLFWVISAETTRWITPSRLLMI